MHFQLLAEQKKSTKLSEDETEKGIEEEGFYFIRRDEEFHELNGREHKPSTTMRHEEFIPTLSAKEESEEGNI